MGLSWVSAPMLPWVAVVAVTGLTAHFCLTRALFIAPASIVGPMEFARLPVIAVAGALVYGETLGWAVLGGAALIMAGNAVNIRAGRKSRV
jgi:drug/metabolite transporter (DMT)-like permease